MASNEFEIDPLEVIDACACGRASIAYPGLVGGSCLKKIPIWQHLLKTIQLIAHLQTSSWSRTTNSRYFYSLLEQFKKALVNEKEMIKSWDSGALLKVTRN